MVETNDQNQERQRHRLTPFEVRARFEGFFDGEKDEIDAEIEEVGGWSSAVRFEDGEILRKEQALEALKRLRQKLEHIQRYVIRELENLHPELKRKISEKPVPDEN